MFDPNENRFGDPPDQFSRPPKRAASPMAMAAISCAILGIMTVFSGFFSLLFGSLAILFACLSRGDSPRPERPAAYALRVGIVAVVISIVVIVSSFFLVIRQYGSFENFYNTYIHTLEQQYDTDDSSGNDVPLPEATGDTEAL